MTMLFASARAFADDYVHFLHCASTNEFERELLADGFAVELRVDVFETGDGMAGQGDQNISDDDAGFLRGAFRFDLENDGGGFFAALQGLTEGVGQTHGLQANTEEALGDVAFFQQGVDDAIDGWRGDGDGAEAREARRSDADGAALRVYNGATDGRGLQADVEADVGSESGACPGAAFGRDETDYAECSHGTTGARTAHDEREITWFQGGGIAEGRDCDCGFRTFQDGEIS